MGSRKNNRRGLTRWQKLKIRWSPSIPALNPASRETRQEWLMFMVNHTGCFPMTEVNSALMPYVSRVTANKDIKDLEERGLVKREKDEEHRAYVLPVHRELQIPTPVQSRRTWFWNLALPMLTASLIMTLAIMLIKGV